MKKLLLGVGAVASSPADLLACLSDGANCNTVKIGANGGPSGSVETPHEYSTDSMYMYEVAIPDGMTHLQWTFSEFEVDYSDDGACSHDQVYIFDRENNPQGPFCGFDTAFANPGSMNYDYNYDSHLGNNNLGQAFSGTVTQNFPLRVGLISDSFVVNYGFQIAYDGIFVPCDDGFHLDIESDSCVDSNECNNEGNGNTCDPDQCVNTYGSYECGCKIGYQVIEQKCKDFDECTDNAGGCMGDSYCQNTEGSFACICNLNGYGYNDGVCSDMDECTTGQCNVAASCTNFDPGYSCICPDGFSDPNGDGSECSYENYPQGWTWLPTFLSGYNIYVSNENFSSQLEAHVDAGANNALIILCEEFYELPYGVWRPGYTYPCNDQLQILTSARYTNQGRFNCYFKDYHVTCNEFTVLFDGYIARAIQEGTLNWDSATIPYEYTSNDGKKWDTAISVGTATFAEAAQICASQGGQLFQEEVDLWGSITDCGAYIEASTKAHGRLFQIPKLEDGISSQVFTGYRANADGSNWCWFDGSTCHETLSNVALGGYVNPLSNWDGTFQWDCSDPTMASAINAGLQGHNTNIGTVIADRCVLWNYSTERYVTASCDSEARFVCERGSWDCSNSLCSDACNPAGFCECPEGKFLTDFFTCTPIPDYTDLQCLSDRMIAWFNVDAIRAGGALTLQDTNCNSTSLHIQQVGHRYRIETKLDECGTDASYDSDSKTITFANGMMNAIDMNSKINMKTRVANTFACSYSSVVDVEDQMYNGEAIRSELEREELGSFGFKLELKTDSSFTQDLNMDSIRVGTTLHFAVIQEPMLSNVVYRTKQCSVFNSNRQIEFILFDAERDAYDPHVATTRYRPLFNDVNGETCASEVQDRYSYTLFEFVNDVNSTIHIDCSIEVCVKEDDMSGSSCNIPCDNTPMMDSAIGR